MNADIRARNEKVHPVDARIDEQHEGAPVDVTYE